MRAYFYSVVLAHANENMTAFGVSTPTKMDYPSVEMLLRLADPRKSVEWCRNVIGLRHGAYMVVKLFCSDTDGKQVVKLLKITKN